MVQNLQVQKSEILLNAFLLVVESACEIVQVALHGDETKTTEAVSKFGEVSEVFAADVLA